ncbi:aspartate ammonia-lyase [Bdellovibrio bacteriovorus W]|nr:aspartate ammonia-lyase [Bdellovibrio bacteriovorus W]
MNYRIEKDLLGEKKVPQDSYYGIHTLRAIENFKISSNTLSQNLYMIAALAKVKKASALANKEAQTLSAEHADAIVSACDEVIKAPEKWAFCFPTDVYQGGAGTSVNMNTNEVLANIALEKMGHKKGEYQFLHPNDHVNKCQSTNDFYPTALRLALYEALIDVEKSLQKLAGSFALKAQEFASIVKMGRTQLQDAVPMSLGEEFRAFESLLMEEIQLWKQVRTLLLGVNLGGTAIGTGVNTPLGYRVLAAKKMAEVTGYSFIQTTDYVAATSECADFVSVSSALKRTAVRISKICNDLRLLSSGPRTGVKEINLPEMQAGSSIMPAKVNPVIPEVVNQICFRVIGNDLTVTLAADASQLQLNVMEPVIAHALFESIAILKSGSETLADKCVVGITANVEHCRELVLKSIGLITYFEPFIGHNAADEVGRECAQTGKTVPEVLLERALVTKDEIAEILSDENLLNPRLRIK